MSKAKKNKRGKYSLPQLKKEISDFLLNEEGKITQKKIAKIGVALGILALMAKPQDALAQSHSSAFTTTGHSSHSSHGSHGSHNSHSSGGWC